ncbi:MAG: DNA translocase FtsK 4TM domain-containing protein [Opitutaceae bacterium]
MPKSESSNPNPVPANQVLRYGPNWVVALLCLLLGAYLLVALVAFDPAQSPGDHVPAPPATNPAGFVGALTIEILLKGFGVGASFVPGFLIWMAVLAFRFPKQVTRGRAIAMGLTLLMSTGLAAMFTDRDWSSRWFPLGPGGIVGKGLYHYMLEPALGSFGAAIVLGTTYCGSLLFVFLRDVGAEVEKLIAGFVAWREERARQKTDRDEFLRREKAERAKAAPKPPSSPPPADPPASIDGPFSRFGPASKPEDLKPPAPPATPAKATRTATPKPEPEAPKPVEAPKPPPPPPKVNISGAPAGGATATDTKGLAVGALGKVELNIVKPEEPKKAAKISVPQTDDANYQFPPVKILREQVRVSIAGTEEEHRRNAENLLRILSEFGVEVTLGEIHVGPVITRYEVVPAPGVRVEKISGLDKNIALGMRAQSVRILAPIPGKAAVGVEVPNQNPTPVGMRELIESEDWASLKAEIPIALGKDVSGKPLVSDLAKMPHLLIAGATGSGKSVCINSIVASILYSKSPKDLRLIMVDPKVVELKIFNTLPHMLIPVVTEPKKVPAALKWLLGEMEQRYQIFAKVNVRNIVGFNSRKKAGRVEEPPPPEAQPALAGLDPLDGVEIPERLPYIVAIIDELADLMMVAPAEIETNIARLAQLARAAGIHLIIATQRPSVNVITGVIKANLPSRIAFQVASQVDSRTILDTKGADTLIGRGDMLFSPPGSSRLVRAQGAFVSDDEVQEMVEFLKRNGPPQYARSVQQQIDRVAREDNDEGGEGEDGDLGDDSELYQEALEVLKATKRASTSMIQRKLRIGYNRAARIMEIMEEKGIVGPENGSSPREILVDLDSM